jgi:hypothetical protein
MIPGLEKATAHITDMIYTIVIVMIVLTIVSAIAAKAIGGKNQTRRRTTAGLVYAIGMILFAFLLLPKILNAGG